MRKGSILSGYRGKEVVYAAGKGQLALYRGLESTGEAVVVTTAGQLRELAGQWEQRAGDSRLPVGFLLGMEGADPILTPGQVGEWWDDGVRVVSLTHYGRSRYAHGTGTGTEGGLLPPGPELLREMEACGMLLDTTHIADRSFWEALDHYSGPILASHQNCRALAPGERQFSDEQIRAVIERDGVVGASMDTWMLREKQDVDWARTADFSAAGVLRAGRSDPGAHRQPRRPRLPVGRQLPARGDRRRHRRPRGDRRGPARDRQHRRLREARPDSRAPRLRQRGRRQRHVRELAPVLHLVPAVVKRMQGSGEISCGNDEWTGAVGVGNDRYGDFVNSFYYFGLQHLLWRACGYFAARFQQQDAIGVLGC